MKTLADLDHVAADLAECWTRGNELWVAHRILLTRPKQAQAALTAAVTVRLGKDEGRKLAILLWQVDIRTVKPCKF